MKADELWEKYANDEASRGGPVMCVGDFLAALKEYGEHFKSEAVKVCNTLPAFTGRPYRSDDEDFLKMCDAEERNGFRFGRGACAAAIEKMPLP